MWSLCITLILGFLLTVEGLEPGQCPEFVTMPDFDLSQYVGRWYETERFDNSFQLGQVCVTADYSPIDDTAINVYNAGVGPDGDFIDILGNATVIDPDVPGSFQLNFAGRPAGKYNVLYTDYTNYSAVYACTDIDVFKQEFAWVLTRQRELPQELLQEAEAVFTSFGIDVKKFLVTYQGPECFYAPLPTPSA